MQTRAEAFALLKEYTQSESLIKHGLAVEAAMKWYAGHFTQDENETAKWRLCGLLHDFDYEKYPSLEPPDGHPWKGCAILSQLGYPEDVIRAIMGHGSATGVPRDTLMAKALYAVDELCGFITAYTLMVPDKSLHSVKASSVKKKLKDKGFARACNREEIAEGAEALGIPLEEHIQNVISGLRESARELGLNGAVQA